VTGFQTAKGSTYEVQPDGTTIRNKAARPEHPGDYGIKPPSETTFYVKPQDVGRFAVPADASWRIVPTNDEGTTFSVVTRNAEGKWGVSPGQNNIPVEKAPALGLHPMELFDRSDINVANGTYPAYRQLHPGNEITQLSRDPKPNFEPQTPGAGAASKPEPTPEPTAQPGQAGYTPPSQQQIDQVVHDLTQRFRQEQQQRGAGVLKNIGDAELRGLIRGVAGILGAPGMILNATDIAYNLANTFFRGRKMNRSIDAFETELRNRLHELTGGSGGEGGGPAPLGTQPPPSGGVTLPAPPSGPGVVGGVIRQGLNTTPAANDQNRSRLKAPPGADMKNRLIYKQR